ncbi:MAG: DUF3179 domain-containing protein [Candidatus Tectomicrobia bacterium]|nr:DUF3179 domain-containing protein [Candidatus Tectomicrobia bacterium]
MAGALSAPQAGAEEFDPAQILTVLPKDAIPAILAPEMVPAGKVGGTLTAESMVLGVALNGDSRAYPLPILSRHEIVNDVVGGWKIAVTW